MNFDYYYGAQSESFAFFRIPRVLVTDPKFKRLSAEAKLLYGLFLDRMSLSMRNNWYDDQGRVFIYYTVAEIQEDMNCGQDKALKLLAELDTAKGIGLIERVKQGQGKPTIIYVKQFTSPDIPAPSPSEDGSADFGKLEVKTSEKPNSRPRKSRSLDLGFSESSYNNINNTYSSYTNPSINPHLYMGKMDRYDPMRTEEISRSPPYIVDTFGLMILRTLATFLA